MLRILMILMLTTVASAFGQNAVQSSWDGGSGIHGPVLEWENCFWECDGISWRAVEGHVSLSSVPLSSSVEEVISTSYPSTSIGYCDIDDDGDQDLVVTSGVKDHLVILVNDGSGGWQVEPVGGSFAGALWVDPCDLDGDGDTDLLEVTQTPDQVIAWLNSDGTGTQWDMYVVNPAFSVGHSVFGSDIDSDGLIDAVGASIGSSDVAVWYNNGNTPDTWEMELVSSQAPGVRTAVPANLDDDDQMEIVGALFDSDRIVYWDKSGDSWIEYTVSDNFPGAHHAFCSDVDFDGDMDVMGASFSSHSITWWRNDGGYPINWHRIDIFSSLYGALISWGDDIDGDGDIDVAASGWNSDRIIWVENMDGSGETWQHHDVATGFNGAWPVITVDVDGDGCLEVVAGADVLTGPGTSHGISSFEVCEFVNDGSLTGCILDTECSPQWASSQWICAEPSGSDFCVSWRTSDDSSAMGSWFYTMYQPGELSGLLKRYVQYRLEFSTGDTSVSPLLEEISLNWDPTGIQGDEEQLLSLWSINGTPCGSASVCIGIVFSEGINEASIDLYDMSGRVVSSGNVSPMEPYFQTGHLKPGVYHAQANAEGISSTLRVVALNR